MAVPSPSLTVPSLLADQLSFQGVTLGYPPNTPFGITELDGISKSTVRSGNQNWSMWPGASPGINELDTLKPIATLDVGPPFGSYGSLAGAIAALRPALSTEGSTEYPLWIQLPGFPLVCCSARVIDTAGFKWNVMADLGQLIKGATIKWEATDPYLYSAPTRVTTIGLPGAPGGFSPPMSFNLTFAGGGTANTATISNAGDVTCWPTLVITGPCLNPTIQQTSLTGAPTIATQFCSMAAGDELWIDCRLGSMMYYPAGSSVGSPSQFMLAPGSDFWGLPPGSSVVAFNSADVSFVAGSLAVWSADAWDGLL